MRRFLIILTLLGISALADRVGAVPSTYFFSDCGCTAAAACRLADCDINPGNPGCGSPPARGTIGNPWCLNPEASGGDKSSFDAMMDGGTGTTLKTELAAGDTVYLCAGPCDYQGTATWYLQAHDSPKADGSDCTGRRAVFDYEVDGPIIITPLGGENVVLSGDANGNNVYDVGEATHFVSTADCDGVTNPTFSSHSGYSWIGGHALTIEKFGTFAFYNVNTTGDNLYEGMEIRYGNSGTGAQEFWQCTGNDCDNLGTDDGLGSPSIACTTNDSGAFGVHGLSGGTITIRDNVVHHICFAAFRTNGNCNTTLIGGATQTTGCTSGITALNIIDNRGWNVGAIYNSHQVRNVTIRGNYFTDVNSGIGLEEQNTNIVVDGNTIGTLGLYDITAGSGTFFGKGTYAIGVNDGDGPPSDGCYDQVCSGSSNNGALCTTVANCIDDGVDPASRCGGQEGVCTTHNIQITRNKIFGYSNHDSNYALRQSYIMGGIYWKAHNTDVSLEGTTHDGFDDLGDSRIENNMIWYTQDSDGNFNVEEASLAVSAPDSVVVRNNTVYNGNKTYLDGASHTFDGNLIVKSNQVFAGNLPELVVTASAIGSSVHGNNLNDAGDGGTVASINGSNLTCAQVNSTPGLGLASGSTNICAASTFVNIAGAKSTWDLHLLAADSANVNVAQSGPTDDIDGESRPSPLTGIALPFDRGADEVVPPNLELVHEAAFIPASVADFETPQLTFTLTNNSEIVATNPKINTDFDDNLVLAGYTSIDCGGGSSMTCSGGLGNGSGNLFCSMPSIGRHQGARCTVTLTANSNGHSVPRTACINLIILDANNTEQVQISVDPPMPCLTFVGAS